MTSKIEMAIALDNFLKAGQVLSDAWIEECVKKYPAYMPSFDEFLVEMTMLMSGEGLTQCYNCDNEAAVRWEGMALCEICLGEVA